MNIYCFSTLSFAKLQFKSVINKAFHKHGVASFTDAWIETDRKCESTRRRKSHLLQMRGLKPNLSHWNKPLDKVASFTDAWIETKKYRESEHGKESRIFYRCVDWNSVNRIASQYMRCRIFYRCVDWNYQIHSANLNRIVASFTDAWIET